MAGGIDLFAGDNPLSGTNLFRIDHNPLEQLDAGLASAVGWDKNKQDGVGDGLVEFVEGIVAIITELLETWTGLDFSNGPLAFIASILEKIKEITGIDLTGAGNFLGWLAAQIGNNVAGIADTLRNLLSGIVGGIGQTIDAILDGILALTGLDLRALANFDIFNVINGLVANVASLGDWIANAAKNVLDIITNGVGDLLALIKTVTGIDLTVLGALNPVQMINDFTKFIEGIFSLFTGGLSGVGKTVTEVLAAVSAWLTNIFKPLSDGVQTLINALVSIFGGTGATVAAAVTALTTWMNNVFKPLQTGIQTLINGIVSAFGGTGATVAAAVTALTNWINTGPFKVLQDLVNFIINGIKAINFPGITIGAGAQGVIDMIGAIFNLGKEADTSAANAHAEIEKIKAANAGGGSDTFEVPLAANLGTGWKKLSTTADTYGPDGAGAAVGKMSGNAMGWIQYCHTGTPISQPDMKVTATVSRLGWWDLFVKSSFLLTVQNNTTDRTCYGVIVDQAAFKFFSMNAAGVFTDIGTWVNMPVWAAGVPYTLEIKGTKLSFYRNGVLQGSNNVPAVLPGRCVGFGGNKVPYTHVSDNPLTQFAGISWLPAV